MELLGFIHASFTSLKFQNYYVTISRTMGNVVSFHSILNPKANLGMNRADVSLLAYDNNYRLLWGRTKWHLILNVDEEACGMHALKWDIRMKAASIDEYDIFLMKWNLESLSTWALLPTSVTAFSLARERDMNKRIQAKPSISASKLIVCTTYNSRNVCSSIKIFFLNFLKIFGIIFSMFGISRATTVSDKLFHPCTVLLRKNVFLNRSVHKSGTFCISCILGWKLAINAD